MSVNNFSETKYTIKLLQCRKCHQVTTTSPEPHPSYNKCVTIYCSNPDCAEFWYVCLDHSLRFASSKYKKLRYHFSSVDHGCNIVTNNLSATSNLPSNIPNTVTASTSTLDDIDTYPQKVYNEDQDSESVSTNDNNNENLSSGSNKRIRLNKEAIHNQDVNAFSESILPSQSMQYFYDNSVIPDGGICGLVARAFNQNNSNNMFANINESKIQLRITKFISTLSQHQQSDFALIIASIVSNNAFSMTRPPLSYNDITRFYTTSQHSIYKNIPSPSVFELDNHACVSIECIIDHMLSFGVELNTIDFHSDFGSNIDRNKSIECTKEAEDIINRIKDSNNIAETSNPIVIYVILWSDDFEANHTRKNRNSTWVKTVTICPPKSHTTSPLYTYPIALGRKGQSHDAVNNYFNSELKRLSVCTLRYSYKHGTPYPVIVQTFCISADRPERSSLNYILSHNGLSTKRWMYSELIPRNKLGSCRQCFKKRCNNISGNSPRSRKSGVCKRCCDWEMNFDHSTGHFLPPINYPTKKHTDSPDPPVGRDVSKPFEKLPPIRVTYETLTKATKFGFWNYLHGEWNKSQTHTYFRLVGISTFYFERIVELAESYKKNLPVSKSILNVIKVPAMWNSIFRLEQCIDTPMHLLFQGITKSLIEESKEYLKFHKVWSIFGRHCNVIMDDLSSVQIAFCKIESFNGGSEFTTGGWIAETYLGFARVSSVLYSLCSEILPSNSLGIKEFLCMIQTFFCLISRLMTDNTVSASEVGQHVKLFLSCCQKYYKTFYDSNSTKNPFWNGPNFLSLLNLPKQIDQFGTMRLHWEGVHERFIQEIKPHLKNMRTSTTYLVKKLDDIHKLNVLKHHLLHNAKNTASYERFKDKKLYKSYEEIQNKVTKGMAILGILYDNSSKYGILINNVEHITILHIETEDHHGLQLNSLWYTPIKLRDQSDVTKNHLSQILDDYVILLPMKSFEDNIVRYTIIGKSWRVRRKNNNYDLPTITSYQLRKIQD